MAFPTNLEQLFPADKSEFMASFFRHTAAGVRYPKLMCSLSVIVKPSIARRFYRQSFSHSSRFHIRPAGFSSSTAVLKNGSPPPVHRSTSEALPPGVPMPLSLRLTRYDLQTLTPLCRLRRISPANDRINASETWCRRSVPSVPFGSAPLSRSGSASLHSTDSVWPSCPPGKFSPPMLWPNNSHLCSVANLVGRDTNLPRY